MRVGIMMWVFNTSRDISGLSIVVERVLILGW